MVKKRIIPCHFLPQDWLVESYGNLRDVPGADKLSFISDPVKNVDYLAVLGQNSTASLISIN